MQYRDTPELAAFRDEIRRFIAENTPPDWSKLSTADPKTGQEAQKIVRQFQRKMGERKWLTLAWPEEYGGLAASYWEQTVMAEEMTYHEAPGGGTNMGTQWVGPAIMLFGTPEQKAQHLNGIANGDVWWCTLYSEPSAGSDLASMQTRAVEDGDDYVVNGQKIWTSGGHFADWGWLAARTDPDAPKHRGITMFTLDMRTPGITIRPLINMADGYYFNEVFFEDVRIPKSNVVGEVNRGWYHMAVALDFERSGIGRVANARCEVDNLIAFVKEHPEFLRRNPTARYELANRAVEVCVGQDLSYRITDLQTKGVIANYEASISKVFGSELVQRVAATGIRLLGPHGMLRCTDHGQTPLRGHLAMRYLDAVSATIGAGTSEIQRNVIATRGLGLPRG